MTAPGNVSAIEAAPRVGIALAAYRPEVGFFTEQLASIAAQDYPNFHCYVTLDSPLSELAARAELTPFLESPRFTWSENSQRLGAGRNFCRGMGLAAAAGARYVACADQDDIWYPGKLRRLVGELRQKPALSLVHADMDVLSHGKSAAESVWVLERRRVDRVTPAALLLQNVVTGAAMLVDAELVNRYGELPDPAILHDEWFAIVAALSGGVYPIFERLHAYRQHGENLVGAHHFQGVTDGLSLEQMLAKREEAVGAFRRRQTMVQALVRHGLPLDAFSRFAFTNGVDGGLSILLRGVLSAGDVTRFRESLALAAGKLLSPRRPRGAERDPGR